MFRRALQAGLRYFRSVIRSEGIHVEAHSNLSIQNGVIQRARQQCYVANFFGLWLQNASRIARARFNPIYQMVGSRRKPTPLLLAFGGFTYLGVKDNVTSRSNSCFSKEEQFHGLQDMLQKIAMNIPEKPFNHNAKSFKDYDIKERLGKASCNSAVYAAKIDKEQYALKMLFNYTTNSQSESLRKAFSKELAILSKNEETQKIRDESGYTSLPDHFNVIKILGHFVGDTPVFYDAMESYPAALPSRFHSDGYGRNRTMFFVLPKFQGTLKDFISKHKDNLDAKKSIALLAQLLEGLVHLNNNKVAHRDLKSDNILVDDRAGELPHLVLTDFDCALAEKRIGFHMPYETAETSRGGNELLMAPEVALAKPGPGNKIDFSRADVFAAGALAYEIFGQTIPFEPDLRKESYEVTQLPELKGAPKAVQRLVKELLQKHPNDRPDISLAATVCQMLLWAPPELCMVHNKNSSLEAVRRWVEEETLALTLSSSKCRLKEDIPVEKQIKLTFLLRTSVDEIMKAIKWLNESMI